MNTDNAARQKTRLTTLVIVSLLLHILLIGGFPSPSLQLSRSSRPLHATLVGIPKSPPAVEPTEAPKPTAPTPRSSAKPRQPAAPAVQVDTEISPEIGAGPGAAVAATIPTFEVSASTRPPAEAVSTPVVTQDASATAAKGTTPLLRAAPLASATLQYKVTANDPRTDPPRLYFGTGTLGWKTDRDGYAIDLQVRVSILFVNLNALSSHSEGTLQDSGLTPRRYTETPRNRSTLAVNFNRDERASVTFSASTNSLPLAPGVQDRLSTLLQLGAVVRANPGLISGKGAGAIELNVAGTRGILETWRFINLGVENIETGIGKMPALHLQRAPRQRADQSPEDQSMDIWLAVGSTAGSSPGNASNGQNDAGPQAYPVKIRFADANATGYELTLEKIE